MGGGSKAPASQTVTQTNIPEYARPYYERLMGRTEAASNQGYTPYGGQRVAGLSDFTVAGMNRIGEMQSPNAVDHAVNMGNHAFQNIAREGDYQSGAITSGYGAAPIQMFDRPGDINSTFKAGQFDSKAAEQYMNPYQQAVTDIAKREAIRQRGQQNVADQAAAASRGSFGGSRAYLGQLEKDRQMQQALDDIQVKGSSDAYTNAQQQFERDRAARYQQSQQGMDAAKTNLTKDMEYGKLGMDTQQFNEKQRQAAYQMQTDAQIANEQARQGASGIRAGTWNSVGKMATDMSQMGKTQQDLAMDRHKAMIEVGNIYQNQRQQELDAAYSDFVNQRDWGKQQLNFLSGILHGVPTGVNSDVQSYQAGPSGLSQGIGALASGAGLYKMMQQ